MADVYVNTGDIWDEWPDCIFNVQLDSNHLEVRRPSDRYQASLVAVYAPGGWQSVKLKERK